MGGLAAFYAPEVIYMRTIELGNNTKMLKGGTHGLLCYMFDIQNTETDYVLQYRYVDQKPEHTQCGYQ